MISVEDRINFYLGGVQFGDNPPQTEEVVRHDRPFVSSQDFSGLNLPYIKDVNKYLEMRSDKAKDLWFQCGDASYTGVPYPVFVKTRDTHNPLANGIIANLNSTRHWGNVGLAAWDVTFQIPWSAKQNKPLWRGVTTGLRHKDYNREDLVKQYSSTYDFGFSHIVQGADHLKEYLKQGIHIQQMLAYKYLVVIDGNDKASSLNWILASTSIPIMPKPRFHSWLCERWLEDKVHYVEVKRDFSDLEEKINWCIDHDKECQEIASNGKAFIVDNFARRDRELEIQKTLINK